MLMLNRSIAITLVALGAMWFGACTPPELPQGDAEVKPPEGEPETSEDADAGPDAVSGVRQCVLSADCSAGTHCDLGECVQRCSRHNACATGLTCSDRGRCLEPGALDSDPPVSSKKLGELGVSPADVLLTEKDERLRLTLSSNSKEPVRYRVVSSAPHLSIAEPRGQFMDELVIELDVDSARTSALDVAGTVRIITNLGELVVDAPLRVGMSGHYEGVMRYELGDVPLGEAQMVVDLQEEGGDVSVAIDPERSLLFPAIDGEATYGEGIYTLSEGLEVTVTHTIDAATGGERNHFGRDIGREITLFLQPTLQGVLEGTFEERIFGMFEQPVTVSGTVQLRTRPLRDDLAFEPPAPRTMPTVTPGAFSSAGFEQRLDVPGLGTVFAALPEECTSVGAGTGSCLERASDFYFGGLAAAFATTLSGSDPIGVLRDLCEKEIYDDVANWAKSSAVGGHCASAGGLLAVLQELATHHSPNAASAAGLFHRTLARLLAPHLLVAQDDLVQGVRESFLTGAAAQVALYQSARTLLSAPARLALQPKVLEFLRRTSPEDAVGDAAASDSTAKDYPGLRALSRLLYVLSSIEGELSSLAASEPASDRSQLIRESQERAVLTVLEASALSTLMSEWPSVPPGLGTELVGALTPLDRGFGTLLEGAVLFGVPEGEIPLAFDPARAIPTNFEQMLQLRAAPALAQQAASQAAFLGATREFEQSQDTLQAELERVRASHEETILAICGSSFDVGVAPEEADWEACGASGSGTLAEALQHMALRRAEVTSAYARIEGIGQRVEIEHEALVASGNVRRGTLRFVSSSGSEMIAMAGMENVLNTAQIALELASNGSLWNAFASVAAGVAAGVLEASKGHLMVRRAELGMLQTMKFAEEAAELETIQAAARVKTLLIEAAQLELDMEQLDIQILQTSINAANLLDLAKRAAVERQRTLRRIQHSPAADPTYRTLMHDSLMQALVARREAQRWLYRAGRALEYETNTPLGDGLGRAILAAYNQAEISKLSDCFASIHSDYSIQFGIPQEFKTTVSVREMLGITSPRKDDVTGEELDEGELFRRILLQNQNLDGQGGVGLTFSTNLEPGNGLWSSGVCGDKIATVRAKLVGDFLGDDEAEVALTVAGGGVLRACDSEQIVSWSIDSADAAVVQAGVNSFGSAAANTTLYGHSVARPNWRLFLPGPDQAPANSDLDLERIDDIVLEVTHKALPSSPGSSGPSLACLSTIGSGG
jgi:hypothetical protein